MRWPGHLSSTTSRLETGPLASRARVIWQIKRGVVKVTAPRTCIFFLSFFMYINKYICFCIMRFGILLETNEHVRLGDTCQLLAYVTGQARAHTPSSVRANQLSWLARRGRGSNKRGLAKSLYGDTLLAAPEAGSQSGGSLLLADVRSGRHPQTPIWRTICLMFHLLFSSEIYQNVLAHLFRPW